MSDKKRSTHQALLGAWVLIAVLLYTGWGWMGVGGGFVHGAAGAALCAIPILGHLLVLRGQDAGGGIVALTCVLALVPAAITLPLGFYAHWIGVYPFIGLVWIAFLLANVVAGSRALRD